MYIKVKYGKNETLVCNPSCAVVNLLNSIKRRTGYGNQDVLLDLSDDTGLVKELDAHRFDYATKHLASHGTYILVEKQPLPNDDPNDGESSNLPQQYNYAPLLDNYVELFPDFKLHVNSVVAPKRRRGHGKSPSPAGIRGIKGVKGKGTASSSRAPSRRR